MNTQLVTIKNSLIDYLQLVLDIDDFKYHQSTISVGDTAKGVIKFFKINRNNFSHNLNYCEYQVTIQIFIMFATNSADDTESQLIEWAGKLEAAMYEVANSGLVLQDNSNQCMGIKPSSRGLQFYSEEISATGRDRYEAWKGTLLAEYEFLFEQETTI